MDVTPHYKIELERIFRKSPTPSEAELWKHLRGRRLNGLHFRRQRPIGRFVADFCCEAARLIVEVDGGYHQTDEQKLLDKERSAHFTGRGYKVVRFANDEITNAIETTLLRIGDAAQETKLETPPSLPDSPLPFAGEGPGVGANSPAVGEWAK